MLRYFLGSIRRQSKASGGSCHGSRFPIATALAALACFLGCLPVHSAAAATAPAAVAGTWAGVLGGKTGLHILLTITQLNSGEYSAQINSVDQGSVMQADSLTVQDHTVGFEIKSLGGVYQGKLNDSGTEIDGTWKQASAAAQPLAFKRSKAGKVAAAAPAATLPGPTEKPFTIPLDALVPVAPTAFKADGKIHLVYEFHVTNMSSWNCVLAGLEVESGDTSSRVLASFSQANLEGMIQPLGMKVPVKSQIAPGKSVVVYMWITLEGIDRLEGVPATLRHRLSVKLGDYPQTLTLDIHPVSVATNPIVIGPPLSGDRWVAANGPSNTSGHRRALIPTEGRATIAQRFAIDWVRVDDSGETHHGDPLDNNNYYAFGAEALAVADGVVTEVLDGVPLNVPGIDSRAVPITLENVGGNHVVLDIGNGHYAFYAHLQPGSLRVKLGDKVRRGQVVGLVGNTGNSTEPHLHFHISDATSPLGAEGLPYALTSFELQGHAGETKLVIDAKPRTQILALPSEGEMVKFVATP